METEGSLCVHKNPPLVPMNPVHIVSPDFPKIHSNLVFPFTSDLLSGLFPSSFKTKSLYFPSVPCVLHAYINRPIPRKWSTSVRQFCQ